jgi:hypothetical protein
MQSNLTVALGAILVLTFVTGIVWLYRVRAAKKWHHFLDGYAAAEILRARQASVPK